MDAKQLYKDGLITKAQMLAIELSQKPKRVIKGYQTARGYSYSNSEVTRIVGLQYSVLHGVISQLDYEEAVATLLPQDCGVVKNSGMAIEHLSAMIERGERPSHWAVNSNWAEAIYEQATNARYRDNLIMAMEKQLEYDSQYNDTPNQQIVNLINAHRKG